MLFDKYKISNYEMCQNVTEITDIDITEMKCVIPKYMSNMLTGPRQTKTWLNQGMFANAPDCKVSIPSTITQQGYITVPKYENEVLDFTSKCLKDDDENLYIPRNTNFMVEVLYEDLMSIRLTGKV